MVIDFSAHGIKQGLVKFAKVAAWQLASIAVVYAGTHLSAFHPSTAQAIAEVAVVNSILAAIGKWLVTVKPAFTESSLEGQLHT